MNNLKITTAILTIAFVGLTVLSCKENKKEDQKESTEMTDMGYQDPKDMNATVSVEKLNYNIQGSDKTSGLVMSYLQIKDALVADNGEAANAAGKTALQAFKNFDSSGLSTEQQENLKDPFEDAMAKVKNISEASIKDQRKAFKQLSDDMTKIIAIAGTNAKLYEQFCPMYDRGSGWLSAEKDIKNPFYGSKMLTCGSVKKEIN